jgi:DNA-binding NarL/FixJ family response regulator
MHASISVAILNDHNLIRSGLIHIIGSFERINDIHEATDSLDLISLLKREKIDIVLIDSRLECITVKKTCKSLLTTFKGTKIILITNNQDRDNEIRMLQLGVHGLLDKNTAINDLKRAIYTVFENGFFYNELIMNLFRNKNFIQKSKRPFSLTERENQIVQLICEEYTMLEIALKLHISEKTVQNHRSSIMQKLGVRNTAGLVKKAILNDLIISTQ